MGDLGFEEDQSDDIDFDDQDVDQDEYWTYLKSNED